MRKRDELTDPKSCMSRARDDEWTFVLLGRDAAAPVAVRAWIDARIQFGKNRPGDPQIVDAERWIEAVEGEQPAPASGATQAMGRTVGCRAKPGVKITMNLGPFERAEVINESDRCFHVIVEPDAYSDRLEDKHRGPRSRCRREGGR